MLPKMRFRIGQIHLPIFNSTPNNDKVILKQSPKAQKKPACNKRAYSIENLSLPHAKKTADKFSDF